MQCRHRRVKSSVLARSPREMHYAVNETRLAEAVGDTVLAMHQPPVKALAAHHRAERGLSFSPLSRLSDSLQSSTTLVQCWN